MKSFIFTVELGSFTAAGKLQNVTTSMVSRNVTELENHLGNRLINRSTNAISLTDAGERYYKEAKVIVDQIENLNESFQGSSQEVSGALNVSCPKGLTECMLMPFIMQFKEKYEDVQLSLFMSDDLIDLAELGYDISIRSGELSPKDLNLVGKLITVNENVICASPSYLQKNDTIENPYDLLKHKLIEDTNLKNNKLWSFSKDGLENNIKIQPSLTVNSVQAVKYALLQDYGVAMLPKQFVQQELENGKFVTLLGEYKVSERSVYALYKKRTNTPKKVKLFIDEMVDFFDRKKTFQPTQKTTKYIGD
ncbi:LysR family transcriptional regulator [Vibrio atlanticus]|nr:LysR family transcriptional regulator [Vibrio atlanticus]